MISILSLVTSVKDYVEIVHKLIESDSNYKISNYEDLGPIITYALITLKDFIFNVISLNWLKNIWDLPIIIPEISSAMISEISVLDGYFHNAFNFLDTPLSYGNTNVAVYSLEKFTIGLFNSLFLFIPTGTAHLITLRRFVMQGLEAGYLAGLGSIFGSILWITSIIFGWRFFVIPWLSLDVFRYLLGFILLVKYMWDSYNERKMVVTSTPAKQKIFLLNFLLALTEQTSIYPFISNISIGSDSSILESFPAQNFSEFLAIHSCYIIGLTLGCLSLLHLTCWFWENPAFKIYMWMISSFKVSTSFYYKVLNFTFLYLTMICAISSVPYYGLDYTLTNPLGFVQDDRILDQKLILETSFLNTKASDRNTRKNRGRHGRRERWKRRIRKYRTFDASLYDQGVYDLFTIEDLNYGFDRFWLRRKMRNHRVRFRFFPGPWMRSFKKQLAKPRLESYAGPRQEFFRILFEQVYHPSFHEYNIGSKKSVKKVEEKANSNRNLTNSLENLGTNYNVSSLAFKTASSASSSLVVNPIGIKKELSIYSQNLEPSATQIRVKENLKLENSTLRKFVRKLNNRIKSSEIKTMLLSRKDLTSELDLTRKESSKKLVYSKRWKQIFSKISHSGSAELTTSNGQLKGLFRNFYQNSLTDNERKQTLTNKKTYFNDSPGVNSNISTEFINSQLIKKQNSLIDIPSLKDKKILKYRSIFLNKNQKNKPGGAINNTLTLLHPLKFYLEKQKAFERKLRYYTPTIFRKFSIENNAPYFRVMMKRYFYYYKPTLRWERTMKVASLRKARRKTSVPPRKIQFSENSLKNLSLNNGVENKLSPLLPNSSDINSNNNASLSNLNTLNLTRIVKPTHNYTIVGKRASRYRYQIYKDVLEHWYYSPFNRLLLKFDIDLFINRQPNSHFLTKNEENLLHLRRFLLSEHYSTLRWYTYMQHYRSMKTKIGGTKSFASGVYNQQFTGTFKKIRHLFAITPSQSNQPVLKFDQPLYNEYFSGGDGKNNYQKNLIIHEELLSNEDMKTNQFNETGKDLLNQSTEVIRDYLIKTNPIKQEYIKKLIEEKNYVELTEFLYKGQKTRGLKPIINEKSLLAQEQEYILTNQEKEELRNLEKLKLEKFLRPLQQEVWINLLKKWKRKVNDQEFLKNYLQRRIEKREKRKLKKERNLKTKLERLENWLSNSKINNEKVDNNLSLNDMNVTTGINKALIEGELTLNKKISTINSIKTVNMLESINFSEKKASLNDLKKASLAKKEKELLSSFNKLSKIVKQENQKQSSSMKPFKLQQISSRIKTLYKKYKFKYSKFITTKVINIFKPIKRKSLRNWQLKERVLNKQKPVRKEFRAFSKKPFKNYSTVTQQSDIPLNGNLLEIEPSRKKRDYAELNSLSEDNKTNWKKIIKNTYIKYFTKKFKRKKSPQRRARIRRNRGVTKKRTLSDSLKRQFKNLRKYRPLEGELESQKDSDVAAKKQKIYRLVQSINQEVSTDGLFKPVGPLQRRSKQKKQRFWKQKRSKYSQKLRKYKKRRRSVLGKVRILNKQLKKIQSTIELKNWWWKTFLPKLRATTDSLWQYEKDRQIQQKLLELSIPEILERDKLNNQQISTYSNKKYDSLQIGDFDYKPLAIPEAIRLRENLLKDSSSLSKDNSASLNYQSSPSNSTDSILLNLGDVNSNETLSLNKETNNDIISQLAKTSLLYDKSTNYSEDNTKPVITTNPIPFYAGWDESLRKFVVTNRLLSRRDSGYEMRLLQDRSTSFKDLLNNQVYENNNTNIVSFTDAPLKGMNAATTLYWQIPFTTYDPDQFFDFGIDGFAPLGWRRFQFRHSILKSWLYEKTSYQTRGTIQNSGLNFQDKEYTNQDNSAGSTNTYIVKNKTNIFSANSAVKISQNKPTNKTNSNSLVYKLKEKNNIGNNTYLLERNGGAKKHKNTRNIYRRLKKRYRRVKKHPRSPLWFPSGPLLNQVLPVHYIYIFYKRSRLPRDRYINRRLRKVKNTQTLVDSKNNNIMPSQIPDFTLRKRVKTKRKYHIKQDLTKKTPIIPRRLKFIGDNDATMRWRPLSRQKLNKPIAELIKEQRALKYKQRKKEQQDSNNKQPTNLRVKQLRRRVQCQIIRSVWRYRPCAGGFVWPGDYLKLETVKAPKLNTTPINSLTSQTKENNNIKAGGPIKVKSKKKRSIEEWETQPKKYLLQKHNYNVIKKKLEKAQRSNKIRERIEELKLTL